MTYRLSALMMVGFTWSGAAFAQEAPLQWSHAQHPRLYLNPAKIADLKKNLRTTYKDMWPGVQKQADAIAATHPPQYTEVDPGGDALWWEMDVGSKLPFIALAYVVTGEKKYFDATKEWTLASCAYPHWGTGTRDGGDLAAGYMLLGVSVVYDWLYTDLDPASRETIHRTLIERGRLMFRQSKTMSWHNAYLQNHMWITLAGLGVDAFALLDDPQETAEATTWINTCLDRFRKTEELLGPDGASHEGITYWSLGVDGLQRFWKLSKDLLGEDVTSPWWKNTGYYRMYMGLPRNSWTPTRKGIDFADGINTDWVGPDYLLRRLAAMNQDGYIQDLANALAPVSICLHFGACWLNPIYYDPSVAPKPYTTLPTMRHFEDMGIVSSRTDWSGNESLLAVICGPALGHNATSKLTFDAGGVHTHPDADHFVLFGDGEWLIRDDGYRPKATNMHNTLLIDGKGQIGENGAPDGHVVYGRPSERGQWFAAIEQIKGKVHPRITTATSTPGMDYVVGDATQAYAPETGLRKYVRQFIFLKPNVLIVADDLETDRPHSLELRFHPQFRATPGSDGSYISRGKTSVLRTTPLTTDAVQVVADYLPAKGYLTPALNEGIEKREDYPDKLFTIQLKSQQPKWRNAVAMSWSPAGQEPVEVTLEKRKDGWLFRVGAKSVLVKWDGSAPEMVR